MRNLKFEIAIKIRLSDPDHGVSYMSAHVYKEKYFAIMERWREWRGTYNYCGQWKNYGANHNGIWLVKRTESIKIKNEKCKTSNRTDG